MIINEREGLWPNGPPPIYATGHALVFNVRKVSKMWYSFWSVPLTDALNYKFSFCSIWAASKHLNIIEYIIKLSGGTTNHCTTHYLQKRYGASVRPWGFDNHSPREKTLNYIIFTSLTVRLDDAGFGVFFLIGSKWPTMMRVSDLHKLFFAPSIKRHNAKFLNDWEMSNMNSVITHCRRMKV